MSDNEVTKRGLFRRKPRDPNNPGRVGQMVQAYKIAAKHYKATPFILLAAILGLTAIGVIIGLLLLPPAWLWGTIGLMAGVLLAMWILGRLVEKAMFAEIKGRMGAVGAVLNALRRSWLADEQPIAADGKSGSIIYRATGRGGVVLISEGSARTKQMLDKERKRHQAVLPSVPVTTIQAGENEGQVSIERLLDEIYRLPRKLQKNEVMEVRRRLTALGSFTQRAPIPKGVDPNRVRPNRSALRGR